MTDLALSAPVSFLRCEKCQEHLDEDDLFCPNCGDSAPGEEHAPAGRMTVHRFDCTGCGASLTWELEVQGLRCAFCGQAKLEEKAVLQIPPPRLIIPFRIVREQAGALYRAWLGNGIFRPGDLRSESKVTEMRGVYLPYWLFSIDCHAWWTADSNHVPPGARAEWAPHFGEHAGRYASQLVPASGVLTSYKLGKLGTWDLSPAVPYTPEALRDHPAEAFSVPRKRARLTAVQGFEGLLREDCEKKVPGSRRRNVKVNPLFTGAHASPVLMPVWIMAFEYRGRTWQFLVNGQSGQIEGNAPVSLWRVLAAVGLAVLAFFLLLVMLGEP
jgi:hypothetical protein